VTVRETHAEVVEAISELTRSMPLGQVHSLAGTIEGLPRFDASLAGQAQSAIANPSFRDTTNRLIAAWSGAPHVQGAAIALALRSAAASRQEALLEESVDAVWTGPTSHHVPIRRTREVLIELFEGAQRRLIVVSFAAYKVPDILQSLSAAAARGVDIRLILETSEGSGGRLSHEPLKPSKLRGRSPPSTCGLANRRLEGTGAGCFMPRRSLPTPPPRS
jgi:hypothetical protein